MEPLCLCVSFTSAIPFTVWLPELWPFGVATIAAVGQVHNPALKRAYHASVSLHVAWLCRGGGERELSHFPLALLLARGELGNTLLLFVRR